MTLAVQQGHAADVPTEKSRPLAESVKEARLRALSARTGHPVSFLRGLSEDTLRRLRGSDVQTHTNEDGSTSYTRDIVKHSDEPGGPRQSAGGTDRGSAEGKHPFLQATGSGQSRGSDGRFTSKGK